MHGSRIGHSPVRGHGLSRPDRAGFLGRVVANREDELHSGAPRRENSSQLLLRKPVVEMPASLKLLQRFGTNRPRRMTSGAVAVKTGFPLWLRIASAMMERAEFPVHRNRTL